jgi:hypothetical protein
MAVKIIDSEPDSYVTQEEYDLYRREWQSRNSMTVAPVSFEQYVRMRQNESISHNKKYLLEG